MSSFFHCLIVLLGHSSSESFTQAARWSCLGDHLRGSSKLG